MLILGSVEQEQLPYDAGTLQLRLSGSTAVELQDMHEALSQRAREITSEMIALDAPEWEYPGEPLPRSRQPFAAHAMPHSSHTVS